LLEQWFPGNRYARAYKFADESDTGAMAVDWLVGAALFMRRTVWEAVGPFDEKLFMYFEETDWCRRCAEAGWPIHYLPQVEVTHYEGQSSGQVESARAMRFQRSKIRYTEKWFGSRWAFILRLFLLTNFGLQWLAETLKWLVGHKRALRRERMTIYWQVLKSGLV
jgi:GT2 family glycosyltransferase